jgi:hypothetical protein
MRTFKSFQKSAPPRAVAGLTFAVALLGTVGCNTVAAPVQDPAPPIDVVAGQPFNGVVDTFTDSDPTATDFGAQVIWGDPEGNVSLGSITSTDTGSGVVYDVSASNTYTTPGDYTATVDFVDNNINTAEGTVPVHVSDTPELDSLVLFGTALMGAGGSAVSRRWLPLLRIGKLRRQPSS